MLLKCCPTLANKYSAGLGQTATAALWWPYLKKKVFTLKTYLV